MKNADKFKTVFGLYATEVWSMPEDEFLRWLNSENTEIEQRWIPCSERLPFAEYGEGNNVLATCGYRDVEDTSIRWIKTLYFNGGVWCYPTGETYEHIVYAWMPLPEPYKRGKTK